MVTVYKHSLVKYAVSNTKNVTTYVRSELQEKILTNLMVKQYVFTYKEVFYRVNSKLHP